MYFDLDEAHVSILELQLGEKHVIRNKGLKYKMQNFLSFSVINSQNLLGMPNP